ncbi:HesA/MoeB/ThiF family protein [Lactococcus protaetiae]|uniref:HesA/MoeB/ThiF family protein n=1 Tax=Lactococcus protaetiae TaxID=2592653 RepID=A0A514Z785_9LACT|nr:HesA/MoeB/ThiF family protein [Lactococcus protaetiae]QDK70444.1 HesA/MoeB/ThiF family protein [Lactococcus protaetiae]
MKIDKNRYDRQIRVPQIGLAGQEKLANSRVLIVGCGALGTYAAEQLTRAGVGHLFLIDPDIVEKSNLQRQALFTTADVEFSHFKVFAAREALLAINPEVTITARNESFEHTLFDDFGKLDLVLDCTDNFLARELINEFCLHHDLPFVFASAAGTSGQVMALKPRFGPCLSCIFPDLIELERNCETIGVVTSLIPLISGIEVSLALQILVTPSAVDWETMHIVENWPLNFAQFSIKKQKSCPCCSRDFSVSTDRNLRLERSCGGVYQSTLTHFNFEKFEQFCQMKQWNLKSNSLVLLVKFEHYEITIFRKGRILFYHFEEENVAQKIFEQIINL